MKKWFYYLFIIILLTLPTLPSLLEMSRQNREYDCKTNGQIYELGTKQPVTEELLLKDRFTKLGICFQINGEISSKSRIRITFKQKELLFSEELYINKIKSGAPVFFDNPGIQKGDFLLSIECLDLSEYENIGLLLSNDTALGQISDNGFPKGSAVALSVVTEFSFPCIWLQAVMLFFSLLTALCVGKFLLQCGNTEPKKKQERVIFLACMSIILCQMYCKYPISVGGGSIF